MKLSFVVITYNSAHLIRDCLASLLSLRSRFETEVLVIDDGSTDDTAALLRDLESQFSQLRYVPQDENAGRARVRNVGLKEATGDYVCFVDSDDFVLANALDQIETALVGAPDIVVPQRVDVNKTAHMRRPSAFTDSLYAGLDTVLDATHHPEFFEDNFITGKFYRRDFLAENDIWFNEARRNAEDILFATLVYLHARHIEILQVAFYCYAWGGYKAGFSVEKCEDVVINTNRLIDLALEQRAVRARRIVSTKVAMILRETVRRAVGVIDLDDVRDIYDDLLDIEKLSKLDKPRFANPQARSFLAALAAGDIDHMVRSAQSG